MSPFTAQDLIDKFIVYGRADAWTRAGIQSLYDDMAENGCLTLDVVALDCDYTEYTVAEAMDDYDSYLDHLSAEQNVDAITDVIDDDDMTTADAIAALQARQKEIDEWEITPRQVVDALDRYTRCWAVPGADTIIIASF